MKLRQFWVVAATILTAVSAVRSSDAAEGQIPSGQGGTEYVTVRVPREYLQQQAHGRPVAVAVQQQIVQTEQPIAQQTPLQRTQSVQQPTPQVAQPQSTHAAPSALQPSKAKTLAAAVASWTSQVTAPATPDNAPAVRPAAPMPRPQALPATHTHAARQMVIAPQRMIIQRSAIRQPVLRPADIQQIAVQHQAVPQQIAQPAVAVKTVAQQSTTQSQADAQSLLPQGNPQLLTQHQPMIRRQAVSQPVAQPLIQPQPNSHPAPVKRLPKQQQVTTLQPTALAQPVMPLSAASPAVLSQPADVASQLIQPVAAPSQTITTVSAQQQPAASGLTPVPVTAAPLQEPVTSDDDGFVTVRVPRDSLTGPAPTPAESTQGMPLMMANNQLFGASGQQLNVQRVIPVGQPGSNGRRVRLVIARPNEAVGSFDSGTAYLEQCGALCGLNGCNSGGCCESNCCPTESCCESGSGCNSCNDCCYQTCDPGHLFLAGVEATFLRARLDRASSSIQTFDAANNPLRNFSSDVVNDSNLNGAPRVWIGAERGCWGVVGRWFDYRAGDMDFGNPAEVPDVVGISHRLHAYAADVELTRRFCCNDFSGRFSFGARRASIDTQTSATLTSVIGPDTVTGTAETHREFDGTGITFGFESNKPIGDPCSGLSWFLRARGSVLWGDAYAAAGTRTTLANGLGATLDNQFAVAATDEAEMTIAEIQTGLQCTHKLECIPALAFLRLAVEWQHWAGDADLFANANSTSAAAPGALINANASASQQTLDLVGLVLAAGFTY